MKHNSTDIAELKPDYLGFIFYEKSSRFFDDSSDIPELPKSIKKVGVFVDASIEAIMKKVKNYKLHAIQLHGDEAPDFCKELRIRGDKNLEIIKVFSIKEKFDFSVLKAYEDVCDYFLFDTKGKLPGGNGYTFDWNVLNDYPSTKPFFLSGGIGLDQVKNLKAFLKSSASKHCYAIDVNSKFEIKPGLKNKNELEEFKYELQH